MKYNERQEIIYPASRVALIFPKNDGDSVHRVEIT